MGCHSGGGGGGGGSGGCYSDLEGGNELHEKKR